MRSIKPSIILFFLSFSAHSEVGKISYEASAVACQEKYPIVEAVSCYEKIKKEIEAKNKIFFNDLIKVIPLGNVNRNILIKYMKIKSEEYNACQLNFEMPYDWNKKPKEIRNYQYADQALAYCQYKVILTQYEFLNGLVNP